MQNDELRDAHVALEKSRDRYVDLYEFSPVSYITINRAELIIEINLTGCTQLGVDRAKLINRRFEKFVSSHDRDRWNRMFMNMMGQAEGVKQTFDLEIIRTDGSTFYAHLNCLPREVVDAELVLRIALVDISEFKLAEARLNLMQYAAIIESSDDAIAGVTLEGIITSWNGGAERMFGYSYEEVKGRHISLLFPEQYKHEEVMLLERIRSGVFVKHYETVRRCKGGKLIDVSVTISPLRDYDGNIVGASKVARDISERKKNEELINKLAFYDTLTQQPNRRMLDDRLRQAMAASKRSGIYSALMFMDLDNFKPLNDTHGHVVGDLLLIEVARRISSCVREIDTVARFGGDEFVVMLGELDIDKAKSRAEAGIVAEKIRASLAEPYILTLRQEGDTEITVEHHCTSSIGVALFMGHEASQDDTLKWADMAMYQAKQGGGNSIRFYEAKD